MSPAPGEEPRDRRRTVSSTGSAILSHVRKRSVSNAWLMTPQRRKIFTARIILKRSAKKHRFTEADVLYEMRNAVTVKEDFKASRVPKTW